jgi:hypothetical protein
VGSSGGQVQEGTASSVFVLILGIVPKPHFLGKHSTT